MDRHPSAFDPSPPAAAVRQPLPDRLLFSALLFLLCVAPLVFTRAGGEFENNPKMAFLQWGLGLLSLGHLLRLRRGRPLCWRRTALDVPVVMFYALCWISLLQAANPFLAVLSLLHWAAAMMMYFIVVNTIRDYEGIDSIFFIAAASVTIVCLIGILQRLCGLEWVPQIKVPASTFSNKNMASQFVAIAFPLTLGSIVFTRRLWMKLVSIAGALLSVLYLLYTQTRSAWLAALAVCGLLIIATLLFARTRAYLEKKSVLAGAALLALVGVLFWVSPARQVLQIDEGLKERFVSMGDIQKKGTAQFRYIWWRNTLHMVRDNFWLGVGLANFKVQYPLYFRAAAVDPTFTEAKQLTRVHNDHLQILAELGAVGFCAYVWMFGAFFYLFARIVRRRERPLMLRALFVCLSVVSFIIIATFTFPMERAMPPIYLFTAFGMMGFLASTTAPARLEIRGMGTQALVRAALAGALVVFLWCSFTFIKRIVLSDRYFVEALALNEQGDFDRANEALQKAKMFSMWNFNIASLLGRNYTVQKHYAQAVEQYREALRVHPNSTNALLNLGYCYLKMKDYDRAKQYLERVLQMMPDSAKAHNNIAIAYFSEKQYDKAIEHYKRAIEVASDYAESYFNLAELYNAQNNTSEAIENYEKGLGFMPSMDDARWRLADMYMQAGQTQKAQETIKPLFANKAKLAQAYVLRGNLNHKKGLYKLAVGAYRASLQYDPRNPFIYHNLGLSYFALQDYANARKSFEQALELNPNIAETQNMLGQIDVIAKDDTAALEHFRKALKLKPGLRDANYFLGTIFLKQKKFDLAIEAYEKTLKIDPGYSLAHNNLAAIHMHRGDNRKALEHFELALRSPSPLIDVQKTQKIIESLKQKLSQADRGSGSGN